MTPAKPLETAMTIDLDVLEGLAKAAAKIAPGLWGSDIEKGEGEYGIGDETHTGYMVPYMETEHGKRLFDAHASDVALIEEDWSFDENGADHSQPDPLFGSTLDNTGRFLQSIAKRALPTTRSSGGAIKRTFEWSTAVR